MTNESDATATNGGENNNGTAATARSTDAPALSSTKGPKLPSLSGKYSYIKSLCESQRPSLGKVMAESSIAMFKTEREIRGRNETLRRFTTTYVDKHDKDEAGQGKSKPFVPSSLRNKQPLNHSKKAKNDSRCSKSFSAMTAVMEKAHALHEKYKTEMSALAKEMGELEIQARIDILEHEYSTAVRDIAEGLFFVGKTKLEARPVLSVKDTALAAAC